MSPGKPKRPAWDLKGRLQDMEDMFKTSSAERENLKSKLADCDSRIINLEFEKQDLTQNLQKTKTVSQASQEELDRLKEALRYSTCVLVCFLYFLAWIYASFLHKPF